jgi:hypothetical protein
MTASTSSSASCRKSSFSPPLHQSAASLSSSSAQSVSLSPLCFSGCCCGDCCCALGSSCLPRGTQPNAAPGGRKNSRCAVRREKGEWVRNGVGACERWVSAKRCGARWLTAYPCGALVEVILRAKGFNELVFLPFKVAQNAWHLAPQHKWRCCQCMPVEARATAVNLVELFRVVPLVEVLDAPSELGVSLAFLWRFEKPGCTQVRVSGQLRTSSSPPNLARRRGAPVGVSPATSRRLPPAATLMPAMMNGIGIYCHTD